MHTGKRPRNTLSCVIKACFHLQVTKFALEKRASGPKCSFPGSDCSILPRSCRWLLMAASIEKSTSCFSLWVKYLRRRRRKSVGGDLKYGAPRTTSELNNNSVLMGVISGEYPGSLCHPSFFSLLVPFCLFVPPRGHRDKGRTGFCSNSWWVLGQITALHKIKKKRNQRVWRGIDRTLVGFLLGFHPLEHAWNMKSWKTLCSCWNDN